MLHYISKFDDSQSRWIKDAKTQHLLEMEWQYRLCLAAYLIYMYC